MKKWDFVKFYLQFTQIQATFYLSQPIGQKQKQRRKQHGVANDLRQIKAHAPQIIYRKIFEIVLVYTDIKGAVNDR